jgi:hypothetical protein
MQGETKENPQDPVIGESEETNRDVNAMDADPPVQTMSEFQQGAGQYGAVDGTDKIHKQKDMMRNTEETKDEKRDTGRRRTN